MPDLPSPEELDRMRRVLASPTGRTIEPLPEDPSSPAYQLTRHGRAEWRDEQIPLQERTADFLHTHAVRGTSDWGQISGEAQRFFPGVDLTPAIRPYEQQLNMTQARQRYRDWTPTTWDIAGRQMVPFVSSVFGAAERNWATDAQRRLAAGRAQPADYDILARSQRLGELYERAGFPAEVTRTIAGLPAIAGEAWLAGGVTGTVSQAVGVTRFGTAALQAAPRTAAVAGWAGRNAMTTAAMPSMYAGQAAENAAANGGRWDDLRNLGPAYATGFLNTAVLGSVAHYGGRGGLGLIARVALGVGEQAAADVASGFMNERLFGLKDANYGLMADALQGRWGDVAKHATLQTITFALLGAIHHEWGRENPITEATRALAEEGKKQGLSPQAIAESVAQAQRPVVESLRADPNITQPQAREAAQSAPAGPRRAVAEALAESLSEKAPARAAPEPPAVRVEAPIAPDQAAAALAAQTTTPNKVAPREGLDANQKKFIENKVRQAGSLQNAIVAYPRDTNVHNYAREYAKQLYGRQESPGGPPSPPAPPEAPRPTEAPRTPPGAAREPFLGPLDVALTSLRARLRKQGLTPEHAEAAVAAAREEGLHAPDMVTGYHKAETRGPTTERAIEHVRKTGEPGVYVEMDLANLGGVNAKLGNSGANEFFRKVADIVREEVSKLPADVHLFRHGGDEMSALVVNGNKDAATEAMRRAHARIKEAAKEYGLADIEHPKHPGVKEKRGTGITFGVSEIDPKDTPKEIFGRADKEVEARKKSVEKAAEPAPEPQVKDGRQELRAAFETAGLNEREMHVLVERGVGRRKLEEIAADPIFGGVSRERVRQIEAAALKKLGKDTSLWKSLIEPGKEEAFLEAVERGQDTHTFFDAETGKWVERRVSAKELVSMAELSGQFDQETGQRLAKAARRRMSAVDQAAFDLEKLSDKMEQEIDKKGALTPEREAYYVGEIERLTRVSQGKFEGPAAEPRPTPEGPVGQTAQPVRRGGGQPRRSEELPGPAAVRQEAAPGEPGQAATGPAETPGGGTAGWSSDAPATAGRDPAAGGVVEGPVVKRSFKEYRDAQRRLKAAGEQPLTPADIAAVEAEANAAARQQAAATERLQTPEGPLAAAGTETAAAPGRPEGSNGPAPGATGGATAGVGGLPPAPTEAQRRAGGLGGGQPDATEPPPPQRDTALAKARVAVERAANDLPQLPEGERVSDQQLRAEAAAVLERDPQAGAALVEELSRNMRPTTALENMVLLHHRAALRNEHGRAMLDYTAEARKPKAARDEAKLDALDAKERVLLAQLDQFDRAVAPVKGEWGRSGRILRLLMAEDYSLQGMLQGAERARGRPLSEAERGQIDDMAARIKELQDQLAGMEDRGEVKPGAPSETGFRLVQAKARFDAHIEAWRRENAPWHVKALGVAGELVSAVPRTLMASIDFPLLRQGLVGVLTRPALVPKWIKEMTQAFFSPERAERMMYEIKSRENARSGLYEQMGIDFTGGPKSPREEGFASNFLKRLQATLDRNAPGMASLLRALDFVSASERGYQVVNLIRADLADSMAASLSVGGKITNAEAKVIGSYVNVGTGRGPLGQFEKAATVLSYFFFAPKWAVSRFQYLLGQPLYSNFSESAPRARALVAKEYGRMVAGLGVVVGLASLAGFDLEKDPRSGDFGRLKVGSTRLDFTGGLSGTARLLAQTMTLSTKNQRGQVVPLSGRLPFGSDNYADVAGRFLRGKLAPAPAAALNLLSGTDVVGNPVTPGSQAANVVTPLFARDVYEAVQDLGVPRGTAVSLLGLLGMSMSTHDPSAPRAPLTPQEQQRNRQLQQQRRGNPLGQHR